MANSTKVAIVGMMILLVVVIAKYVKNDVPVADGRRGDAGKSGAGEGTKQADAGRGGVAKGTAPEGGAVAPSLAQRRAARRRETPGVQEADGGRLGSVPVRPAMTHGEGATRTAPRSGIRGSFAPIGSTPDAQPPVERGPLVVTATTPEGTTVHSAANVPPVGPRPPAPGATPPVSRELEDAARDTRPAPGRSGETAVVRTPGTTLQGPASDRPADEAPVPFRPTTRVFEPSQGPVTGARDARVTTPPTGGAVAAGFPKQHTLEKGESPWALAERYYGRGFLYEHIQRANAGIKFHAGKVITIPPPPPGLVDSPAPARTGSESRRRVSTANPPNRGEGARSSGVPPDAAGGPRSYVVQKGDTLSAIAKRFYGNAKYFTRIEDANEHIRYTTLLPGTKLTIP